MYPARSPSACQPPSPQSLPPALWVHGGLALLLLLLPLLWPLSGVFEDSNLYLSLHIGLKFISVAASLMIFAVGWISFHHDRSLRFQMLACAFLIVAVLDLLYTLSYPDMPRLGTPNSLEKALNFWLAARMIGALAVLMVALWPERVLMAEIWRWPMLAATLAMACLIGVLGLHFPETAPRTWIPGQGPTASLIAIEGFIIVLRTITLLWLIHAWRRDGDRFWALLTISAWVLLTGELGMIVYLNASNSHVLVGPLLNAWGKVLILWAVCEQAIYQPYRYLGQTYQALRDREEVLRHSLAEIQRHVAQMAALNHLNDSLLSCETREEAYAVIAPAAGLLFTPHVGRLFAMDDETAELRCVAAWGCTADNPPSPFNRRDCWALQRGKPLDAADLAYDVRCRHFQGGPEDIHLCLPLAVRGETLGVLQIGIRERLTTADAQGLRHLAIVASESIELALSNLKLREVLREQAIRDPLTGLFNRRYLDETLPRELHRCRRAHEPVAVAMLDIDHFKHFNDVYGHESGDRVLQAVGSLLRQSLRAGDIACRYGGEEMTLVLPGAAANEVWARLEALRQTIMQLHLHHRERELPVITVSIGLAAAGADEADAVALLRRADAALYRAKAQGRNRIVIS
ncbi:MAG: diguanylate cyclase [Gammaproteobacteria bacterium]|nr:diguanylate cyclase [Gammaproteobacteria bacterium]